MCSIWMVLGYMLSILIGSCVAQVFFSPREAISFMDSPTYGFFLYGGTAFLYLLGLLFSIRRIADGLRAEKKGIGILTLFITIGAFAACAIGLKDTIAVSRSITQETCLQRVAPSANLSHCDLAGANLSGRDLNNADLVGVDFSNADLSGAILANANLQGSNLSNAQLSHSDLSGANLYGSQVENTNFTEATLRKTNLSHSWTYAKVDFSGLDLTEADLSYMSAEEVDFTQAKLNRANLQSMRVEGYVSFRQANLDDAALNFSYFHTADFSQASMRKTDLSNIGFSDRALFENADLEQAVLFNFPILDDTGLNIELSLQQVNAASVFMPTPYVLCGNAPLPWASSFDPVHDKATKNIYFSFVDVGTWTAYGYMEPWPQDWKIPESWSTQVTDARDIEIIICDAWNYVRIEHCSYALCGYDRVRIDRIVTIKLAQTGNVLDEKVFPGSEPEPCLGIVTCPQSGGIRDHTGEKFQNFPAIIEWIMTVLD